MCVCCTQRFTCVVCVSAVVLDVGCVLLVCCICLAFSAAWHILGVPHAADTLHIWRCIVTDRVCLIATLVAYVSVLLVCVCACDGGMQCRPFKARFSTFVLGQVDASCCAQQLEAKVLEITKVPPLLRPLLCCLFRL